MTTGSPEDQRILEGLIRELEDRGAELDDVLAPHDGWRATMADRDHAPPLAQPEPYGHYLTEMLKHGDLHD
jgi:hypothetical protein